MTVSEFLDRTARFDGILVGDNDYARRRLQHLEWLQESSDEFCLCRPFAWRLKPLPIVIAANVNFMELPDDFVEFGAVGSVVDPIRQVPLVEKSPIIIQRAQGQPPISVHYQFAVFKRTDASASDPGALCFQLGANGAAQSFQSWYLSAPPTFVDTTDQNSGLDRIPAHYHLSVLMPRVKAKILWQNDAQSEFWAGQALLGLQDAIKTDGQGRNSAAQVMPSAVRGQW